MSGGLKNDQGKPDLSLVPLSALVEEAKGFMFGAKRYGRYNYTKGLEASRLIAAALRHIHAWNTGEELDPESGASHLGHARCCLAMLLECARLGTLRDDRLNPASLFIPTSSGIKPEELNHVPANITYLADGTPIDWTKPPPTPKAPISVYPFDPLDFLK